MTYLEYEEYLKEKREQDAAQDLIDNPPMRKWLAVYPSFGDTYYYVGYSRFETPEPWHEWWGGFVVEYTPEIEALFKQGLVAVAEAGFYVEPDYAEGYDDTRGIDTTDSFIDGGTMKGEGVAFEMIDAFKALLIVPPEPEPEPSSLLDLFPDL